MVTIRIRKAGSWEVVLVAPPIYGDAAGYARRLRAEGYVARRQAGEVIVEVQ